MKILVTELAYAVMHIRHGPLLAPPATVTMIPTHTHVFLDCHGVLGTPISFWWLFQSPHL